MGKLSETIKDFLLYTVKKIYEIPDFFDQTFLGLEEGTLFTARGNLVSDIPAGDGNIAKLFLQYMQCQVSLVCATLLEK